MSQQRLTDRSLAPYITGDTLIHIVNTGDTTQYAGGSSYKATIDQVSDYYLNNYDVYITGTTFGSNQSVVTRNDGFDVFKLSGGSNVTLTNPSTNQILIDVAIPPDTNTFVTGGTYLAGTATFTNNTGGTFNVTGFTSGDTNFANTNLTLTGNRAHDTNGNILEITSDAGAYLENWIYLDPNPSVNQGSWIGWNANYIKIDPNTNIFVQGNNEFRQTTSEIVFNSPANDVDFRIEGQTDLNLFFVDASTDRVGIGTVTPIEKLHISGGDILVETSNGKVYSDIEVAGISRFIVTGGTSNRTSLSVITPNSGGLSMGIRGSTESAPFSSQLGKQGDGYIYSSIDNNGLNIISQPTSPQTTDDYIRFFAGQSAGAGGTPDIHIQGSGTTKGFVGFGLGLPTSKVDITTTNGYQQLRLRQSYTPTSTADTNGNVGDVAWDDTYFYIKTNTGWGRLALDYVF